MSTKNQTHFRNLPQSFGGAGLFNRNPQRTVRPLPCRCCYERPTRYLFAEADGNFKPSETGGWCERCASRFVQQPTEDEVMLREVAAYKSERDVPVSLAEIERMAREADEARDSANAQWLADWKLLEELHEKRALIASVGSSDMPGYVEAINVLGLDAIKERVAFIEREYPFLEDPMLGLTDNPPYPFNAPFAA